MVLWHLAAGGPRLLAEISLSVRCHIAFTSTFECSVNYKPRSLLRVWSRVDWLHVVRILRIGHIRSVCDWLLGTTIQEHTLMGSFSTSITCFYVLLCLLIVSEIEDLLVDGKVTISLIFCRGFLSNRLTSLRLVWKWTFLQTNLNLIFASSLESVVIKKRWFMLTWVDEAFSIRGERLLVGRIEHWSNILSLLCQRLHDMLVEVLRRHRDVWELRGWWLILGLEDHCWIVHIVPRWRGFITDKDACFLSMFLQRQICTTFFESHHFLVDKLHVWVFSRWGYC